MELCDEMIKVMQHFRDGGEVEFNPKDSDSTLWIRTSYPNWNWADCNFRIKEPDEKVTIEKWLMQSTIDKEYRIFETSLVNTVVNFKKIKIIESYEIKT